MSGISDKKQWWVYLIETDKGLLYTGISTDVERRFQEHLDVANGEPKAKGAKFFRGHVPIKVVYKQAMPNRSEASQTEWRIKKMSKIKKIQICQEFSNKNG